MNTLEAVHTALRQLRVARGAQQIACERPPLELEYSIDPNMIRDSLVAAGAPVRR